MGKVTVIIADDHKLIREAWRQILDENSNLSVIATCGDAQEVVDLAKEKRPELILMDIMMNPFSGLEATRKILAFAPKTKIIGVSLLSQPAYAKKMLTIGGRGYVTKNSSQEEMMEAIFQVIKGRKYICAEVKNIVTDQALNIVQETAVINRLTHREIEIINLIKKGHSSREIAAILKVAIGTVESHRYNILKKLHIKNVASLVNLINNSKNI
jgi:DNA-binding NarL/FixJ family response regulator